MEQRCLIQHNTTYSYPRSRWRTLGFWNILQFTYIIASASHQHYQRWNLLIICVVFNTYTVRFNLRKPSPNSLKDPDTNVRLNMCLVCTTCCSLLVGMELQHFQNTYSFTNWLIELCKTVGCRIFTWLCKSMNQSSTYLLGTEPAFNSHIGHV